MELKKKLNLYPQNSSTQESLDIAVETIRKGIKWCKSTLNWPPHIQNLELDQTIIEKYTLADFLLCKFFNGGNSNKFCRSKHITYS